MSKAKQEIRNLNEIGKRIQDARKSKGLTQEVLASRLDVTPQTISNIETGNACFSVPLLLQLCDILYVSSDYILYGKEDMTGKSELIRKISHVSPDRIIILEKGLDFLLEITEKAAPKESVTDSDDSQDENSDQSGKGTFS